MPTSEKLLPRRHDVAAEYSYRRPLGLREMLPAIGIGIGAGLFAYYVTRILLERTPLRAPHADGAVRSRRAGGGGTRSPERTPRP